MRHTRESVKPPKLARAIREISDALLTLPKAQHLGFVKGYLTKCDDLDAEERASLFAFATVYKPGESEPRAAKWFEGMPAAVVAGICVIAAAVIPLRCAASNWNSSSATSPAQHGTVASPKK